jgi:putative membrane protein
MPEPSEKDPRVYFAAEQTFLSWIRTGIALMGFGFAIDRFALFMREMQATTHTGVAYHPRGSALAGVTLIVLGIIVNIAASLNYSHTVRELSSGTCVPGKVSRTAILLATLLAILGTGMAIYLLLLH